MIAYTIVISLVNINEDNFIRATTISIMGLLGNIVSPILANATYGIAFAFLVVQAQLARYDWRLDDAAMVFGTTLKVVFKEVTFL